MGKTDRRNRFLLKLKRQWPLHLMLIPMVILLLVYAYYPMSGILIAFEKFNPRLIFLKCLILSRFYLIQCISH